MRQRTIAGVSLVFCMLATACGHASRGLPATDGPSPVATAPPAAADPFGNPYAGQSRTHPDGYVYTTDLVEGRVGPNRFRFPANFYYDQIGPDFQGSVSLILLWPRLEPVPPGIGFHDHQNLFDRRITASLNYVDAVPIEGLLDRKLQPMSEYEVGDPLETLELRRRGKPVHGLTPYYTDFEKLEIWHRARYGDVPPAVLDRSSSLNDDWYVARGRDGKVTTYVECTSHEVTDGIRFEGDRVVHAKPPIAQCMHFFTLPGKRIEVWLRYKRAFLHDWRRIEHRVRTVLDVGAMN